MIKKLIENIFPLRAESCKVETRGIEIWEIEPRKVFTHGKARTTDMLQCAIVLDFRKGQWLGPGPQRKKTLKTMEQTQAPNPPKQSWSGFLAQFPGEILGPVVAQLARLSRARQLCQETQMCAVLCFLQDFSFDCSLGETSSRFNREKVRLVIFTMF